MTRGTSDPETLELILDTLKRYASRSLPLSWRLEVDAHETFPQALMAELMGPEVGLHLIFIPQEFGGMGGGAYDVYRVSEALAGIELGLATAFLAISLGLDPIVVGGTEAQKQRWMSRAAEEGLIVAYGVTEPAAGSDLSALRTKAERIEKDGVLWGYRLTGAKQFITNGGVADFYTILAATEGGPTFFIVEKGAPGLTPGKPEEKHGIRASNTTSLTLEGVEVPLENMVGGVEGQGLAQAQKVFGYTRLMVAAFGLGGGEAALRRAIAYAADRLQGGSPLTDKQAFTHKLLVPHAVRLAAARAFIEEVALRLDGGEEDLQTEGAVAKLFATEAGNAAADAAIQALGGYGYTHEYEVEKIRRDVRITTIYEGTSEIMQWTIARDRWRLHLLSKGGHYARLAEEQLRLAAQSPDVGASMISLAYTCLRELFEKARVYRLTRHQHFLFRLGELSARVETAAALARAAAGSGFASRIPPETLRAMARINARDVAATVAMEAATLLRGCDVPDEAGPGSLERSLRLLEILAGQGGQMSDMDLVARQICSRDALEG